jgi:hypothetical protein
MDDLIFSNGVDFDRGTYTAEPVVVGALAAAAARAVPDPQHQAELRAALERQGFESFGFVPVSFDPAELESAGWGAIFPLETPHAVVEALRPLLEHRRSQAGSFHPDRYREIEYRPDQTKAEFLHRLGQDAGAPGDPGRGVSYYLLLVGSPRVIPWRFQYELDVDYAVGRIWFENPDGSIDVDAFARYARSVVEWEQGPRRRSGVSLFGPVNPGDAVGELLGRGMIQPLAEQLPSRLGHRVEVSVSLGEAATKSRLSSILARGDGPALLLAATHGVTFAPGHPRRALDQGALICQDWSGPFQQGPLSPGAFFGAEDLISANVHGLIAVLHASYSAGTPEPDPGWSGPVGAPTPAPFVARLPQALLAHPDGGALAVVGFCDQVWGPAFPEGEWPLLEAYAGALKQVLRGLPTGLGMDVLNQGYWAAASHLDALQQEIRYGRLVEPSEQARLWVACLDARHAILLGDPAVRTHG